jgi:hypothetical protein
LGGSKGLFFKGEQQHSIADEASRNKIILAAMEAVSGVRRFKTD